MKKFVNSMVLSLVLVGGILSSGVSSQAATRSWEVHHYQGAPSTVGVFKCSQVMPKGGVVCRVTMTSYQNLRKTDLWAYRKGYKSAGKAISESKKTDTLDLAENSADTVIIEMSTSEAKTTSAAGVFTR